jgi:hypothetical protein
MSEHKRQQDINTGSLLSYSSATSDFSLHRGVQVERLIRVPAADPVGHNRDAGKALDMPSMSIEV